MPKIHYEAELTTEEFELFSRFLCELRDLREEKVIVLTVNKEVVWGEVSHTKIDV